MKNNKRKNNKIWLIAAGIIVLLAAIMIGAYCFSSSHTEDMLHGNIEHDDNESDTDDGGFTWDNDWEDDNDYRTDTRDDLYDDFDDEDDEYEDVEDDEDEDSYTPPSTSSKKRKPYIDEPDVDDYTDPEEFYYYHPYDFLDFEDAENYYYDHGGE